MNGQFDASKQGSDLHILIGVTGHRDLAPESMEQVRLAVRHALGVWHHAFGSGLRVVTALADGADQLVAEVAQELSVGVVALLPMERARYRQTLSAEGAKTFDRVLGALDPTDIIELPDVEMPEGASAEKRAAVQYEQLGILLCRQCHLLLALWDGYDAEPLSTRISRQRTRRGGTAHVVSMRMNGEYTEVPVAMFDRSILFAERLSRLELARSGPVLQIAAPRVSRAMEGRLPGQAIWWDQPPPLPNLQPCGETVRPQAVLDLSLPQDCATLAGLIPASCHQIATAGQALGTVGRMTARDCEIAAGELGVPDTESSVILRLVRLYAQADLYAYQAQQNLIGSWSPGLSWPTGGSGQRRLGALFAFGITIPIASACFEIYCEYGKQVPWLLGYIVVLALSFALYRWVVKKRGWQNHYQDYRALAEALRVQTIWAASGIPLAASDNYLRHQEDEIGWIRLALRGPSLMGIGAALRMRRCRMHATDARPQNLRTTIHERWVVAQRKYFATRIDIYDRAVKVSDKYAKFCLIGTYGFAVVLVLVQIVCGGALPEMIPEWLREVPTVLIGVLPAVAAFFLIFKEARAYEDHLHSYSQSLLVFKEAAKQAARMRSAEHMHQSGADEAHADWEDLVIALGRQALMENAIWIQTHRARPVGFKSGG
ncbi:hypothetical protein [Acetobacter sp. LMG 32666]|uniref:hypothetical protein n=1 Tax=Acetobacter sp. LMG 32666 TaxID=2959295 RepID=UPI0030C87964